MGVSILLGVIFSQLLLIVYLYKKSKVFPFEHLYRLETFARLHGYYDEEDVD